MLNISPREALARFIKLNERSVIFTIEMLKTSNGIEKKTKTIIMMKKTKKEKILNETKINIKNTKPKITEK
jgi:DNA-binding Lrp family transcriptional regulator